MKNLFTTPSVLDQREVTRFQASVMDVIPEDIRMLEISPVAALGSNSALSGISQKTVLGTIRNTEVVADAVSVLALELARQRNAEPNAWAGTTLGTFHRELRTQVYKEPQYKPHYHALSLVRAEHAPNCDDFKTRNLAEQIGIYLDVIDRGRSIGYGADRVTVNVSNLRIVELAIKAAGFDRDVVRRQARTVGFSVFDAVGVALPKKIPLADLNTIVATLPNTLAHLNRPLVYAGRIFGDAIAELAKRRSLDSVDVVLDLDRHAGMGYYQDLCVKISSRNLKGETYELVDIGTNDWLSRLTHRRADRLMTGGMGTELFMTFFRDPHA
ncbi:hypothetical protein AB0F03_27275 [Streptomyces sp. NPDC028722]|uniref:hypothetical protein n=1 Tax=Streptomyces sp. NPDC028722 TaxID=3155016 RepID=UPI0033FA3BAA